MAEVDFEAEGLLEGLSGKAKEARLGLLQDLYDDGVPLDELKEAVKEDRLVLLPTERVFDSGEERYTAAEVAERAGLELDFLVRLLQALGAPIPAEDEPVFTDTDVEAAKRAKLFLDAGLPPEGVLETSRLIGISMANLASANRDMVGEAFTEPGVDERELGQRYAAAARTLAPLLGETLLHAYRIHLQEGIRQAVISEAELAEGRHIASLRHTVWYTAAQVDLYHRPLQSDEGRSAVDDGPASGRLRGGFGSTGGRFGVGQGVPGRGLTAQPFLPWRNLPQRRRAAPRLRLLRRRQRVRVRRRDRLDQCPKNRLADLEIVLRQPRQEPPQERQRRLDPRPVRRPEQIRQQRHRQVVRPRPLAPPVERREHLRHQLPRHRQHPPAGPVPPPVMRRPVARARVFDHPDMAQRLTDAAIGFHGTNSDVPPGAGATPSYPGGVCIRPWNRRRRGPEAARR